MKYFQVKIEHYGIKLNYSKHN